jgi:hypothetical protein
LSKLFNKLSSLKNATELLTSIYGAKSKMGAEYQQKKGHDLPDSHQGIQLMGKVLNYRSGRTCGDSGDLYPPTFDREINPV